jgi:uncharacterized phiE125 gp8 family phage protein
MIDVNAAKAWLKVETADEDALIGGLVAAAVGTIEAQTGKAMSVKSFTQQVAGFPCRAPHSIILFRGPVTAITEISYDPADGSNAASLTDFRLVDGVNAALMPAFGQSWPATVPGPGSVRITFTAGYAADQAPELDQAALLLVAHWHANREAAAIGAGGATELPLAVDMLIQPYRARRL